MVARLLLYGACLFLSACLAGSDSKQSSSPISYDITSLGSERYQVAFKANIPGEHNGYWQFGDGYVSAGRSVNHIYYSPGQYTISYSYEQNGQQKVLTDTLVLEGATQNLEVISRELITIDSDHNDPNQPWQRNDISPQVITAPSKVSGVMLAKGSCNTGKLCSEGDDVDRYRLKTDYPVVVKIQHYDGNLTAHISNFTETFHNQHQIQLDAGEHLISLNRMSHRVRYTINIDSVPTAQTSAYQPGKLIVHYHNKPQPELLDISDPRLRRYNNLQQARSALQKRSDVSSVSYNYWRFPNNLYQWSLTEFGIPLLWQQLPSKGANIRVAVIDTGLFDHDEFNDNLLVDGYDFISDPLQSDDGDGWDNNPLDSSGSGHGTHVTGIIASQGQLNSEGLAGISPNVEIMPLRAIGRFGATSYDLIQSILYASGLENDTGQRPSRPADIINLSLGGESYSQIERDIIEHVSQLGVLLIAASGNQGNNRIDYPAAYPNVLAVGAHDRYGNVASYSNYGSGLDVIAPGGTCSDAICSNGIISLSENGYQSLSGTSMATAHTSAILANLKSYRTDIDNQDLAKLIANGQLTDSNQHSNQQGWGILDANKIAKLVDPEAQHQTRLWIPKQSPLTGQQQKIRLPIVVRGPLPLDSMNLSIRPDSLEYTLTKISDGFHELSVTNTNNAASISIDYYNGKNWKSVTSDIVKTDEGFDIDFLDHLYVQLDNQRTPFRASHNKDGWQLQFPEYVAKQTIQVSSDIDYDGIYCEAGEFCGQKVQCDLAISRSLQVCDSSDPARSPLSGQLISHD